MDTRSDAGPHGYGMTRSAFSLMFAAAFGLGCGHARLAVRAAAVGEPATVTAPCGDPTAGDACLGTGQPTRAVDVQGASSIHWARLDEAGDLLVASLGTRASDGPEASFVAAFDLKARRELWRIQLADGGRIRASDCFLLPSGILLAIPGEAGADPAMVILDRTTGMPRAPASRARVLAADEQNDFVLTGDADSFHVVDGATGAVTATFARSGSDEVPRVYWTATAAYLVDGGVTSISRKERKPTWQQRFATYASYDQGERAAAARQVGAAVVTAVFLTALTRSPWSVVPGPGPLELHYEFGRTSEPVESDGLACIGSLGIVTCFNTTTGALVWSRRFPVTQFRAVAVMGSRGVCALAGGFYLHRQGDAAELRESPFRALYCVRRSDGSPLTELETTFSSNRPGTPLTRDALQQYNPTDDDANLIANGMPPGEKSPRIRALAAVGPGILVAQDEMVRLIELPTGQTAATADLTELGRVKQLAPAGDTIVASAGRGFAGFDAASGALRWKTSLAVAGPPLMTFSDHDPPGLVRTMPTFAHQIEPAENVDTGMYWLLSQARTIVAAGVDGRLAGISLDDGAIRWRLSPGERVAIDGSEDHPSIVTIDGAMIRVYKLPSARPAQPPPNERSRSSGDEPPHPGQLDARPARGY